MVKRLGLNPSDTIRHLRIITHFTSNYTLYRRIHCMHRLFGSLILSLLPATSENAPQPKIDRKAESDTDHNVNSSTFRNIGSILCRCEQEYDGNSLGKSRAGILDVSPLLTRMTVSSSRPFCPLSLHFSTNGSTTYLIRPSRPTWRSSILSYSLQIAPLLLPQKSRFRNQRACLD